MQLKNILFIDIETVASTAAFDELPERFKPLWKNKARYIADESIPPEQSYTDRAAIYAEFGKIIVIGVGFFFYDENKELGFRTKALADHDEKALLIDFRNLVETKFGKPGFKLCAHNGREFDYPYLCRRLLVHGLEIPDILKINDKKPWEIPHLDTLELWKFGDKKSYTSLELLAAILDVPTSKDDIDGSKVNQTYYHENGLQRIAEYCKKDVVVTAQIFLRLNSLPLVKEEQVFYT